jgi:hypothetical protein
MPNFTPPRLLALSACAIISLSACATVNVSDYGTSPDSVSVVQTAQQGNIITRSVMRLYNVFVNRGLYEDTSRKRVQSTANILLNGLQTPDLDNGAASVIEASTTTALLDDVQTARYHIEQTTKAAEVYLEIASGEASLLDELKQLQKALRVSEKVTDGFVQNKLAENYGIKSEILGLQGDVNKLRGVTDEFGDFVRARRIAIASQTAS